MIHIIKLFVLSIVFSTFILCADAKATVIEEQLPKHQVLNSMREAESFCIRHECISIYQSGRGTVTVVYFENGVSPDPDPGEDKAR